MFRKFGTWVKGSAWPLVSEAGVFGVRWLQLVGLLHCVQEYGIDFSTTVGASMVPVFNASGDVLLYERLTQRLAGWSRGEVVVATSPKDPDGRICKRILGLQGDRVKVWSHIGEKEVLIPRGHVWLEGDNKAASHDSRHYGPVPVGLLQGKVRLKLWPSSGDPALAVARVLRSRIVLGGSECEDASTPKGDEGDAKEEHSIKGGAGPQQVALHVGNPCEEDASHPQPVPKLRQFADWTMFVKQLRAGSMSRRHPHCGLALLLAAAAATLSVSCFTVFTGAQAGEGRVNQRRLNLPSPSEPGLVAARAYSTAPLAEPPEDLMSIKQRHLTPSAEHLEYAVVEYSGRQHMIVEGGMYETYFIRAVPGSKVRLNRVLLLKEKNSGGEFEISVGQPLVDGAYAEITILEHLKGEDQIVFKHKKKKHYMKRWIVNQKLTRFRVDKIVKGSPDDAVEGRAPYPLEPGS
ncbi:imp1 [Symbiodinium necroappetens]|uniref:Imp1 protein n=1 Tax=Symbiodinium necroappetens TaxID=1628268 RepID=A0A812K3H5_9DINO|nr:imp1 [Symbiodinium necroappetens]